MGTSLRKGRITRKNAKGMQDVMYSRRIIKKKWKNLSWLHTHRLAMTERIRALIRSYCCENIRHILLYTSILSFPNRCYNHNTQSFVRAVCRFVAFVVHRGTSLVSGMQIRRGTRKPSVIPVWSHMCVCGQCNLSVAHRIASLQLCEHTSALCNF
jgi:hypothetical protein